MQRCCLVKESFECLILTEARPTPVKLSQFELLIIQHCTVVHELAVGSEGAKWFYCGYRFLCNHWPLVQPQIYIHCERERLLTIILFMIPSKWVLGWSQSQVLTSLLSVGFHSLWLRVGHWTFPKCSWNPRSHAFGSGKGRKHKLCTTASMPVTRNVTYTP